MSGGQAIYILPCAVQRKGAKHEASPSQHSVRRAKQVGPAGHLQPASRGQPSVCDHVETATAYASANRKAQREGNHNNKHVAPPCDATQDLLVVREGVLSKCCGLGQGPATRVGRRSLTPLPCPQSRQSKRRPHVYTSNRKQRPASSATKALLSLVVATRESEPRQA